MQESGLRQLILSAFQRFPQTSIEVCLCICKFPHTNLQELTFNILQLVEDKLLIQTNRPLRMSPTYELSCHGKLFVPLEAEPLKPYDIKNLEQIKAQELTFATHQQKTYHFIQSNKLYPSTSMIQDFLEISHSDTMRLLGSLVKIKEIEPAEDQHLLWRLKK